MQKILTTIFLTIAGILFWSQNVDAAIISRSPPNLGLVGYWSFNDASTTLSTFSLARDYSGNNNRGTLTSMSLPSTATSGWNEGKLGKALAFDGSNDTVVLENEANFDFERTQSFSIAAWVYPRSNGAGQTIFSKRSTSGVKPGFELTVNNLAAGRVRVVLANNTSSKAVIVDAGSILPLNTWSHVVMTYSGTSVASGVLVYINGVSGGVTATQDNLGSNSILTDIVPNIGSTNNVNSYWDGLIDEVRVYNRALSVDEVRVLYKIGTIKLKMPANLGLVGYWSFNDASTTRSTTPFAEDYSGNGNRGSTTNMSLPSTATSGWNNGKFGMALAFDGTDDLVDVSKVTNIPKNNANQTISVWFKYSSAQTGGAYLVSLNGASTKLSIGFGSGAGYILADKFGGTVLVSNANMAPSSGIWHHYVYTFDGTTHLIYIDGIQNASGTVAADTGSPTSVTIGNRPTADLTFNGLIDEVRIYNRALTPAEVLALYKVGSAKILAPTNLGLVGYWSFNDASTTRSTTPFAEDYSGNNLRGTLTNISLPSTATSGWNEGRLGKALAFDGANDVVTAGTSSVVNNMSAFSISAWLKPSDTTAGNSHIITKAAADTDTLGWLVAQTQSGAGRLRFEVKYNVTSLEHTTDTNTLTQDIWQHIVVTWDGSSAATNAKIYINGVEPGYAVATDGSGTRANDSTSLFSFGARSGGGLPYTGLIDEVRIYNRVLSVEEVQALYKSR